MSLLEHYAQERLIETQQKSINSVTDALFNRTPRQLTPREELDECIRAAHQLKAKVMHVRDLYPDKRGGLAEAEDMMKDVLTDLIAQLHDVDLGRENFELCSCGKCDSCVVARSDEHYDRKRDGALT